MKKRIGEKSIRNLEAPEAGNRIDWDDKLPGFGVRITASGVTSFILDYYVAGRRRRYTIGRHPEMTANAARARAEAFRVQIRDGYDPMEDRVQSRLAPTVEELAAEYIKDAESRIQKSSPFFLRERTSIFWILKFFFKRSWNCSRALSLTHMPICSAVLPITSQRS